MNNDYLSVGEDKHTTYQDKYITYKNKYLKLKNSIENTYFSDGENSLNKNKHLNLKQYSKGGNTNSNMKVFELEDSSGLFYQELFYLSAHLTRNPKVRNLIKDRKWGMKKIVNKPADLTKAKYNTIFPPHHYLLTDKADGIRCLVSVYGNRLRLLADKLYEIYIPRNKGKLLGRPLVSLADAELMFDEDKNTLSLYLFDVMVFKNDNVSYKGYETRIHYLNDMVSELSKFKNNSLKTVKAKNVVLLDKDRLEEQIKKVYYDTKYPYSIDGLIFTEPGSNYQRTRAYKWKPLDENTADFLVKRAPKSFQKRYPQYSKKGYTLYLLFVSITNDTKYLMNLDDLDEYGEIFPDLDKFRDDKDFILSRPIHFSPSFDPQAYLYYHKDSSGEQTDTESIDGEIVEMRRKLNKDKDGYILKTGSWDIVRIRFDRKFEKDYYGNHFSIAESLYNNYVNPLNIDYLWKSDKSYFQQTEEIQELRERWKPKNIYHRFVVTNTVNKYVRDLKKNVKDDDGQLYLVDLASGRGADLGRYMKAGVDKTLFMDIDIDALTELIERKLSIIFKKQHVLSLMRQGKINKKPLDESMLIQCQQMDLTTDYKKILATIKKFNVPEKDVDLLIMNFAIHYMFNTEKNVENIVNLVDSLIKKHGYFIFTTMSGEKVFNFLKNVEFKESRRLKEDNLTKYEIKKLYKDTSFKNFGQRIAVKLPFSEEMYEEPLCNIDYIVKLFEQKGFSLIINKSFIDDINRFKKENKTMYSKLTNNDKKYIDLHHMVIVYKE